MNVALAIGHRSVVLSYHNVFLINTGATQLVFLANCVEYYCYKLNSMKPVVYQYDADIQDSKVTRKVVTLSLKNLFLYRYNDISCCTIIYRFQQQQQQQPIIIDQLLR